MKPEELKKKEEEKKKEEVQKIDEDIINELEQTELGGGLKDQSGDWQAGCNVDQCSCK